MDAFLVRGGRRLSGRVRAAGAKNAALPALAAALVTSGEVSLCEVPAVADIRTMRRLLAGMGVAIGEDPAGTLRLRAADVTSTEAPYDLVRTMRASILVLGPLLARFGEARVSLPGGCAIGVRPVDLHVDAMRALGAEVEYRNGYYFAKAPGRLRGGLVEFPFVTVMGTENAILAATLAEGHTVIRPAAQEPETDDLIEMLRTMGAEVERTAPDTIEVEGRRRLRGTEHRVLPDRIEAGTFVVAAAITGGDVAVEGVDCEHLGAFLDAISSMGVSTSCTRDRIEVRGAPLGSGAYVAAHIATAPYPGFATDLQPPTGVLLSQATGTSRIDETIFEDRLEWLSGLARMGATVRVLDRHHAEIDGPARLHGRELEIGDLRAGASIILAALVAEGTSVIHGAHHVQRGYENIERKFLDLGARIERLPEDHVTPA